MSAYISFDAAKAGVPAAQIPHMTTTPTGAKVFALALGHFPSAAFIPWLLTDNPYYLEGAQATALYGVLETQLFRNFRKISRLVDYVEPRGLAWGMRASNSLLCRRVCHIPYS
jgi:hypothetical protein